MLSPCEALHSVLSTGVGEEEEVVEAEIGSHGVETLRMSDWKGNVNSEATIETRCETQRELRVIMKQMIAKGLAKAFEPERRWESPRLLLMQRSLSLLRSVEGCVPPEFLLCVTEGCWGAAPSQ